MMSYSHKNGAKGDHQCYLALQPFIVATQWSPALNSLTWSREPMTIVYLMPPTLSILLLTVHFFRGNNLPAMIIFFLLLFLLFIHRPWTARIVQIGLLLGSIEWVRTTISLVSARIDMGEPFIRLAFILGGVSLLTACSALVFRTPKIKTYFKINKSSL